MVRVFLKLLGLNRLLLKSFVVFYDPFIQCLHFQDIGKKSFDFSFGDWELFTSYTLIESPKHTRTLIDLYKQQSLFISLIWPPFPLSFHRLPFSL